MVGSSAPHSHSLIPPKQDGGENQKCKSLWGGIDSLMCKAKAGYASKTQALFTASYQPFPENQASIIFTLDFFITSFTSFHLLTHYCPYSSRYPSESVNFLSVQLVITTTITGIYCYMLSVMAGSQIFTVTLLAQLTKVSLLKLTLR